MTKDIPNSRDIERAADLAAPIFRRNGWTWRDEKSPPTLLDIATTYSSLAWELDRIDDDGRTRYAATGRLLVVRTRDGYRYAVEV